LPPAAATSLTWQWLHSPEFTCVKTAESVGAVVSLVTKNTSAYQKQPGYTALQYVSFGPAEGTRLPEVATLRPNLRVNSNNLDKTPSGFSRNMVGKRRHPFRAVSYMSKRSHHFRMLARPELTLRAPPVEVFEDRLCNSQNSHERALSGVWPRLVGARHGEALAGKPAWGNAPAAKRNEWTAAQQHSAQEERGFGLIPRVGVRAQALQEIVGGAIKKSSLNQGRCLWGEATSDSPSGQDWQPMIHKRMTSDGSGLGLRFPSNYAPPQHNRHPWFEASRTTISAAAAVCGSTAIRI